MARALVDVLDFLSSVHVSNLARAWRGTLRIARCVLLQRRTPESLFARTKPVNSNDFSRHFTVFLLRPFCVS